MSYLARLVENRNNSINFDLTKSFQTNKNINYSENESIPPIQVSTSTWKETHHNGKNFLEKTYKFENVMHLKYFFNECIDKSESTSYYPELFIKGKSIRVFLKNEYSIDIDENDLAFSKFLDEIYEDIFYIKH
jgi:pterin-4a-carbinolamine dehydratase